MIDLQKVKEDLDKEICNITEEELIEIIKQTKIDIEIAKEEIERESFSRKISS